ncbi:glycosyltransferase [Bacteroides thetaiotaomicron]|nr:glycosyltransferase [Bacteroides thetaiotaomicron]
MKKKICVITTIETTLESFVIPVMRLFMQRGFDVTLMCMMSDMFVERYEGEFHLINVKMNRGISLKDMLTKPFEFYKIFKREKFNYVQYATTNAAWYASVAAKMAGVPVRVNCLWGLLYTASTGWKRKVYWFAEKYPCWFSNYFIVASKKNMEIAIADGLCKRERVSVIGDGGTIGVDLKVFDYGKREECKLRMLERYPVLKGKLVYGYLGRIDVDKGVNELLKAFLAVNNLKMALVLMGSFDDVRSGLDNDLIEKAKASENVIFTGFTREVALHLSVVDVLVHPTYREGFSMVIQQAMAMGCAIITTDIPGPSEVIVENESGLLVQVKDSEALQKAMRRMYEDKVLREAFVKAGLKRVEERFKRERMLELTYENRCQMMKDAGIID